jgi:predicted acylesterase/phospholipase RssA
MAKRKITKLLVCGGGFKFYYIYGSIQYLYEINILQNIQEYIGVSAGAMLSLLFAIGYTPNELEKFFVEFDFDRLIDPHIDNLLEKKGLDDGELLKVAIQQMLNKKNINPEITFNELYKITNKKLTFVAANITRVKLEILDHLTEPNMPIWQGILITSALPMIYSPVIHNNEYLIDGGAFDNYPIELFQDESILGINLALQIKNIDLNIELFSYMIKLYTIMHHWHNTYKIDRFKKYTIEIPTYDATEIMNTNVSTDEKRRRIKHGYSCAVKYFEADEFQEPTESESNQIGESTSPIELTEEEKEEEKEEDKKDNLPTQEEIVEKVMSVNYIV